MDFLAHMLRKHRDTVVVVLVGLFLVTLYISSQSRASFAPGTELDPSCEPGDPGCTVTAGGSGWGLSGNSGTVDGTDFIGTTDGAPINFRVHDENSGRIAEDGSTFIGFQSGQNNTNSENAGFGFQAFFSNTTGTGNTALGFAALFNNTTGDGNTAVGFQSLNNNISGTNNTANGIQSLYSNTTGIRNTATGYQSLYNNTTGASNTANGISSLNNNDTGSFNGAFGYQALNSNTSGDFNVAIGAGAGLSNSTGSRNVFLGYQAGYSETGSDTLYIDSSSTTTPLIFGDFSTDVLTINGDFILASGKNISDGSSPSINTNSRWLADSGGVTNLDWSNSGGIKVSSGRYIIDDNGSNTVSINTNSRWLADSGGVTNLDWSNSGGIKISAGRYIIDDNGSNTASISTNSRWLIDSSGGTNLDWNNTSGLIIPSGRYILDDSASHYGSIDTNMRVLYDAGGSASVRYEDMMLLDGGVQAMSWSGYGIKVGSSPMPKGITLYDTSDSSDWCVKITAGVLVAVSGECTF